MTTAKIFRQKSMLALAVSAAFSLSATAQENIEIEEVLVQAKTPYGNNLVSDAMLKQQSSFTSVNAVIDNLPGVTVNEGDVYGFDDWSTSITIRGFTTNLGDQQIGTTIDGMPNGGSNYGGGAKANRFIDSANLQGVEVSQGTADIASRSHEALGGTLNYLTNAPEDERRLRGEVSLGDQNAHRYYLRYDTGLIGSNTRAWVSYTNKEATDWITETAENENDHFAAKIVSSFEMMNITAYLSYDDVHEDNYQRVYSEAQYDAINDHDGLTGVWTGVPVEDQLYRRGWSTLRENLFAYVKFDVDVSSEFKFSSALYHHHNEGRGDWLPPYLHDVTTDSTGAHSEFTGGTTARGTSSAGRIYFVDPQGNALAPRSSCVPSYSIQNWYGVPNYTAAQNEDPRCYSADAIAVMSFRNTHYEKDRLGLSFDGTYDIELGSTDNEIRAGFWWEDQTREEYRDWHSVDTRAGFVYNNTPYWIQYDRSYPQDTFKWYLQDNITAGDLTISLGMKQFLVEVEREDNFQPELNATLDSDSDVLFSGGVVWQAPVEGMEVFFGYAENFKALSDLVLERPAADFSNIEPETSENYEFGVRYNAGIVSATAVYFQSDFENRLFFVDNSNSDGFGPNFDIGTNGTYFNIGGIESEGLELSAELQLTEQFSAYGAYTYTDSTLIGTGDAAVDNVIGVVPGNKVPGIPENQFVASLDWTQDNMFAGISAKLTGDRQVNLSNDWTAESYTITDVYAGYDFMNLGAGIENLRVNLTINNLFDEEYLGTIAENAAWLGGPRTATLSATIDF